MKKLNKSRDVRGSLYWPTKWYQTASDYRKIDLHAWDIRLMLEELKKRLIFSRLRLKHAEVFLPSTQEKAELRFQKRILDEHMKKIEKLLEENEFLQRKNYEKEHGESFYNSFDD